MNELINNKKEIYILLTSTNTLLGKLIRFYSKEPFNHVSIAFDIDLVELYSFGRKNPNNPFIGGFIQEDIKSGTYAKFNDTTCLISVLDVSENEYLKMCEEIEYFKINKEKYKFNFIGILSFVTNTQINRKNYYFCSQFVATILNEANIKVVNKDPIKTKPSDFLKNNKLRHIYSGKLNSYSKDKCYRHYEPIIYPIYGKKLIIKKIVNLLESF